MPSIDAAMARSLQAGVWETTKNALKRDVVGDAQQSVDDVTTALSSWDNCMEASFCKYPVIAIIIVGSLILISILTCIIRCACCAKSCCCSCFSCFKCCGNCCGCCDSPEDRDKKNHKYLDAPFIPPNQGYRTEAPMNTGFGPAVGHAGPPQYAEFDVSKKPTEDSLPQMPSWEGAGSKKVEMEQEAMEMNSLDKSNNGVTTGVTNSQEPTLPVLGAMAAKPTSPMPQESPQGRPIPTRTPMMNNAPPPRDPYAQSNPYGDQGGYGMEDPYGLPPAGMAPPPSGRNSPGPMRNGYGPNDNMGGGYANMPAPPSEYGDRDPYRNPSPGPGMGMAGAAGYQRPGPGADPYGQRTASPGPGYGYRGHGMGQGPNRSANNSPASYGMDPRMRNSPGPRSSPRPGADPYNRAPTTGPGGYGSPARTYSPVSERQFNESPRPMQRPGPGIDTRSPLAMQPGVPPQRVESPSSPIVNNGGFDFTSGFSRPQTANSDHYNRRPSESREPPAQEGYPGYKPYRPAQEGWSGV